MADFLSKWQTLIGSFIGGIVGLLAALLVAYKERRRDENASAMLLIGDLTVFIGSASAALRIQSHLTNEDKIHVAERLIRLRPMLSQMFDASMMRVMSVDNKLAAHLNHFKMFYSGVVQILDRLESQFRLESAGVLVSNKPAMADVDKLIEGLCFAIKQAEYAIYFLDDLFLTRCCWWKRMTISIRRRYYPTEKDKESNESLHPE